MYGKNDLVESDDENSIDDEENEFNNENDDENQIKLKAKMKRKKLKTIKFEHLKKIVEFKDYFSSSLKDVLVIK